MGRPAKTDDPRRTILEAARALVLEHGHQDLSLRAVAAKAGFSPASLYEYFEGKDDLMGALAQGASAQLGRAMQAAIDEARTAQTALVGIGEAYVCFARDHREDFLLLFQRLPSRRSAMEQAIPENSPYAVLAGVVREALVERGHRPSAKTVEHAAYALWSLAHGLSMLQLTHLRGFAADFDAADKKALTALVRGLDLKD